MQLRQSEQVHADLGRLIRYGRTRLKYYPSESVSTLSHPMQDQRIDFK
jgi:siderophore synthetase component